MFIDLDLTLPLWCFAVADPRPPWTPEEQAVLRSARLVVELEKIRGDQQPSRSKPTWQRFLESTGGAALITVLVGGIAGGLITSHLETRQKDRELAVQKEQAAEQRKSAAHKELLTARLTAVQGAIDLLGRAIAAGEDLIVITGPEWRLQEARAEVDAKVTRRKKEELREGWNTADAAWRSQRHSAGLLLAVYSSKARNVAEAWRQTEETVAGFLDCARDYYVEHATGTGDPSAGCREAHTAAIDALVALPKAVGVTEIVGPEF